LSSLADIQGVGLGLKRELIPQIQSLYQNPSISNIDFVEIAPENWIGAGGKAQADLAWFVERYPIACHGLCLSLGGPDLLNVAFLKQVKQFLSTHKIPLYTEHLSYCSDNYHGKTGYLFAKRRIFWGKKSRSKMLLFTQQRQFRACLKLNF
jgi:uncharacterized protein